MSIAIAALACPIGMGVMMWMMMRGQNRRGGNAADGASQQIDRMRAEIAQLEAERLPDRLPDGR